MSYYITGTDTGIGKTLVSCGLLYALADRGIRASGFKPVSAGVTETGFNDDAIALRQASGVEVAIEQVNPYCLDPAIAPHIAAQRSGARIDLAIILSLYDRLAGQADTDVVEGAGGILVPLNESQNNADLAKALDLPVIVVVGMRLGCLNHALLTVRALEDYGLKCAGWVANVLDRHMEALQENIDALRERVAAPLLAVVPYMPEPDAKVVSRHLDLGLLRLGSENV